MLEKVTINIMVKNVAETINFYHEKLGFEKALSVPESGDNLNFAIVQKDNVSLMFQEQNNLLSEYPTLQGEDIKPMFTLFINVSDASKLYNDLKDKVGIAADLHKTFYGKNEFAIFDNNGNVLTLAE